MKSAYSLRRLIEAALIAALYTVLTLVLAPIGFGPFQCRLSEALTILPALTPTAVPGLFVGCVLSNAIGLAMGVNAAGALDILIGSAATLLAALISYALRSVRLFGLPVLSALPPIVFNALFVGAELSIFLGHPFWFAAIVEVGAGEAAVCLIGGLFLAAALLRSGLARRLFVPSKEKRDQEKGDRVCNDSCG